MQSRKCGYIVSCRKMAGFMLDPAECKIKIKRIKRSHAMKHKFYDVKTKSHVEADVTEKVTYGKPGNERYAFRAKTADGRALTAFVSKAVWEKASL